MTAKPQTKSNAKRAAGAATRRSGIEHTVVEAGGGWVVAGPPPEDGETAVPGSSKILPGR